ncbi:MAG TPA: SGNH/GDSL hydrolase family protein [Syntrophales bacterium]|nr:SGNH/GDSL hydrolase family protein [Syntrophales bacterium]
MKKPLRIILVNVLLILLVLGLFEGFFYLCLHRPAFLRAMPMRVRNMVGYLYARERPTIQFEPACARFDPGLGYTLRPGVCDFGGREFTNRYRVNSLGVRDEEGALDGPEVVVLGDSFAMGWGVEQEETFAKVLERKTGLKVLNTAVSSYGTAREMMILKRVPAGNLRWVIIQYCGNDREENYAFLKSGNRLRTMTREEYDRYVDLYQRSRAYYPGKYLYLKLKKRFEELQAPRPREDLGDEAELFLKTIVNAGVPLDGVKLVAFVMNGRNPDDNRPFPRALKERIASGSYPAYIKDMIVLDFSDLLGEGDFYVLDDHLNRHGHEVIAQALAKVVRAPQNHRRKD